MARAQAAAGPFADSGAQGSWTIQSGCFWGAEREGTLDNLGPSNSGSRGRNIGEADRSLRRCQAGAKADSFRRRQPGFHGVFIRKPALGRQRTRLAFDHELVRAERPGRENEIE